jgi:small subunit ribosomal protein S8e
MPIEQSKSKRKLTGGRLKDNRKSRRHAKGNHPIMTQLGERKVRTTRTLGGSTKVKLAAVNKIMVTNLKTKKTTVEELTNVSDNPANTNFIRRNIITKGAIVETKAGKVKITSRPGQNGVLSGILQE